jgi:hypothetical protein
VVTLTIDFVSLTVAMYTNTESNKCLREITHTLSPDNTQTPDDKCCYQDMPSTVIAHINYNPETGDLRIGYVSGHSYVYKQVPEKVYKELKASQWKGRYLQHFIKGHYNFELVS